MKKLMLGAIIGILLGGGVGFALGIFVYPYAFLADIVAAEPPPVAGRSQIVARGRFIHADPSDPIHYGRGAVTVHADTVHLGPDFEVGPGPKFHVYLVQRMPVTSSDDVKTTTFIDLGRLRAFKGSQNYRLPAGIDLASFGSVVIWCEAFGVLISPAALVPERA